jgi:hypothetical protein
MTIVNTAVKKIIMRMGFDKETPSPMYEAEEDRAVYPLIMKRDPEVMKCLLKPVNMVISHAVILGEYDLDGIPPDLKLTAESEDHISKTTNFGHRSTLCCNHDDKHVVIP